MINQADRLSDRHFKLLTEMAELLVEMAGEMRKLIETLDNLLKEIGDKK